MREYKAGKYQSGKNMKPIRHKLEVEKGTDHSEAIIGFVNATSILVDLFMGVYIFIFFSFLGLESRSFQLCVIR